jgi:hypothetical protein
MKSQLVFELKDTWDFRFGGTANIRMDCYKISDDIDFTKAFVLSWIAYDPEDTLKRVLMDQHQGRPCHFHIDDKVVELERPPRDFNEAYDIFRAEVVKYFGEILETT